MKHHPPIILVLIVLPQKQPRQCLGGSLSGALTSQKVTEASLRLANSEWKPE